MFCGIRVAAVAAIVLATTTGSAMGQAQTSNSTLQWTYTGTFTNPCTLERITYEAVERDVIIGVAPASGDTFIHRSLTSVTLHGEYADGTKFVAHSIANTFLRRTEGDPEYRQAIVGNHYHGITAGEGTSEDDIYSTIIQVENRNAQGVPVASQLLIKGGCN